MYNLLSHKFLIITDFNNGQKLYYSKHKYLSFIHFFFEDFADVLPNAR